MLVGAGGLFATMSIYVLSFIVMGTSNSSTDTPNPMTLESGGCCLCYSFACCVGDQSEITCDCGGCVICDSCDSCDPCAGCNCFDNCTCACCADDDTDCCGNCGQCGGGC